MFPPPPDLCSISDMIPEHARAMPDHPVADKEWPLRKIESNTENIFRVVVTVDNTNGSKLAMV